MEENKNLTPENEDENTSTSEEIVEAEPSFEEPATSSDSSLEDAEENAAPSSEAENEANDIVSEEPLTPPSSDEEISEPKKSKSGVVAAIIAVCAVVALIILLAVMFLSGNRSTEGTGNLYAQGFATIKGNDVYHVNFADYKMYKTNLKTGESAPATDDFAVYITNYENNIYYLGLSVSEDQQTSIYEFRKYVDGVNDVVMFEDAITTPQISDGYVYYLKSVPEFYSGYCSRIYRAPLKEGSTPELCCDVLCNSFYVDGEDLYYCDVETTTLMKTSLSTALDAVSTSPLAEGAKRSSEELSAEPVLATVAACPTIVKDTLYYIDGLNKYELRSLNLKTGEDKSFNNGVFATAFNIYGDHIYYHNQSDYSVYRMKTDGSDVTSITAPNYGYTAISHDKFMSMEISSEGYQYINVCDLDGNVIHEITFEEQYSEYYDESSEELTEDETVSEDNTEETTGEVTETEEAVASEDVIETTIDLEE